ncbi:hypothetical protein [Methanomicrobium mobile]|uniref:hypothetical protein n=1 Tax=Methanomicrobium mobile TaxID=2205 RepID=UPI0005B2C3AF|nr:hypothetical protein [Methanomicrobium mobile]
MKNNHGKAIKRIIMAALLAALILSAGCIGQDTGAANGQNANTAQATATPTPASTEKLPIPPEKLAEFMPASSDTWKAEELMYGTEKDGLTLMSWASQTYKNAMSPASVTITIQDTMGEPIGNADGWEYFYDFTYPNYEMHAKKVQEYPSWLIFDREADTITQLTMIENRIVVSIDVANGQLTYITPYENAISFKKLAELTK